jgi:glycosyltransferase involved in cell wall biosynthesis
VRPEAIKTLVVTDSLYPVGGVERSLSRLLRHFDPAVVSPKMVVLGHHHPLQQELPRDVPIDHIGRGHVRNALPALSRVIVEERPDILYSAKTHVNAVAVAANLLAGRPSCAIPSERLHLSAHVSYQTPLRKWKWYATLLVARALYRRGADAVVFVSQGALDGGRWLLGLSGDKATVIYNPIVDDELFGAAKKPVDHPWFAVERERPVILGVGRLTKQKGFSYLLRAFRRVRRSLPSRLVLVGAGEEYESLGRLVQDLGIGEDVAFLGFQDNPCRFLARCDVFVLPSLWEGFGVVLVEALACGAPAIAACCPSGPDEIVRDGVDGLLVPPADVDALADALLEVLTNPGLARSLSAAGRRRGQDFRADRAARQYEQLFRAVLASRSAFVDSGVPNGG